MKVYVLLAQSHGEIMNAEKVFVDENEADQFAEKNTQLYSFYKEEKELELPKENINTVEEILDTFQSLATRLIRIDVTLSKLTEADSNYKEYMDERKEIEKQLESFKKQRVLNLKEVDEQ